MGTDGLDETNTPPTPGDALAGFSAVTRDWFNSAFPAPTPAQQGAWAGVQDGAHTLVVAPTGSGKTLAAFLAAIDDLISSPTPSDVTRRCRVLYISPLKALAADVERNLRSPLAGITQAAARAGVPVHTPTVATRTGDTSAKERRDFNRVSADILITTPESLFLVLTSAAREQLAGVTTVIVDEVHALAGSKRGAHLAVSLERLDALLETPAQRIGLSATVRPVEEVARFLAGSSPARPVRVVNPVSDKQFELRVEVPVPDLAELGAVDEEGNPAASSIWPHVEERIVDLLTADQAPDELGSRSSIVFANSRRLSERLTGRLNEIWAERLAEAETEGDTERDTDWDDGRLDDRPVLAWDDDETDSDRDSFRVDGRPQRVPAELMGASGVSAGAPAVLARAHHGSVSKEQRQLIEDDLKSGRLPAVVATSSLELGIDMGAVDLVVQVESPPSVASGLQRVGRAGHQVGAVSRAVVFPKYRADLLSSTVVVERMRAGQIEELTLVTNPLDVAAQQIVAMVALQEWSVDDVLALLRRTANFSGLSRPVLESVIDMLAGRYPSEDFAELRPRLVWDRLTDTLTGRAGAQRLAVTSGGTIPDRGLFGVFLAGESDTRQGGRRVGELDEEMVYESRVGDVFTLGASSWQIVEITHDQVRVVPAPGRPGRLPFWHGDQPGRPYELGRALGGFVRELGALSDDAARRRLEAAGLDEWACDNLLGYLQEQRRATTHLPDDQTIVLERFRDELGDWRVVLHSPFGMSVHAPWAMAISAALREQHGVDVQAMPADDGIVLRLPDTDLTLDDLADEPGATEVDRQSVSSALLIPAEEIMDRVGAELGGSALFASRFRECAARALLLPRRRPDRRSPLWQQRQRAAQLLEVASRFPSFPIVLETVRECLSDVFDVPGLAHLLTELADGRVRLVEVETTTASPFARSLLFGYVAQFLYEGDSPLAERRAAALSLDPDLLAELLGSNDLTAMADLLDTDAIRATHAQLQRLADDRRAGTLDQVDDLIRELGPLTGAELAERCAPELPVEEIVHRLVAATRVIRVRVGGAEMLATAADAGRLRDGLGTALPVGLPVVFTELVPDPIADLVLRRARRCVGFTAEQLAARWGLGVAVVRQVADRLRADGRLVCGVLLPEPVHDLLGPPDPGPTTVQYCHVDVMRLLRRRSLAALRAEVEPVPADRLARFVPTWQNLTRPLRGPDGVLASIEQLAGLPLPASAWESLVLPGRVRDYRPGMLDELTAAGDVVWAGHSRLGADDGWISLHPVDLAPLTLPVRPPAPTTDDDSSARARIGRELLLVLRSGGGFFVRELAATLARRLELSETEVAAVLPEAIWGHVWAGEITGDTLAPVRALIGGGRTAHRTPRAPRARYGRPGRATMRPRGEPTVHLTGRWSALPPADPDPTGRAALTTDLLLDRYGVVTRGSVVAEDHPGGFATVYRVLSALEETGRVRRGYFVEGLGASQFATSAAVDRLRAQPDSPDQGDLAGGQPGRGTPRAIVLAATDPANVYGAALPWPEIEGTHRPARRAGALVVLADGRLLVYAERGARSVLCFTDRADELSAAATALAHLVRDDRLSSLSINTVNSEPLLGSEHPLVEALKEAGFHPTPKGLRLRR